MYLLVIVAEQNGLNLTLLETPKTGFLHHAIIGLCWGGHGVLLNSKCHIDWRGAEVNMIKFTVQ